MIIKKKGIRLRKATKEDIKSIKNKAGNSLFKKKNKFKFKKLVSRINSKNLYPEINFGPPVGKEIF